MTENKETSKIDVVVLMSVYNGQKYLKEQIDSIIEQDYPGQIEILVRDDGSKDHSVDFLSAICPVSNRSIRMIQEENVGVQKSFLRLLHEAPTARYYFFADQDDVWDADKISKAVLQMGQEKDVPVTFCSNYRISDMDLNITVKEALKEKPDFTPLRITFYNEIPGCTMGFNRALMDLIKKLTLQDCMMHDSMVLALAAFCGTVIYDHSPLITHRIHTENVVGTGHKKIIWHKWFQEKLSLLVHKEDYDLSEMAGQFLEVCGTLRHEKYTADLELLRDYRKSWKNTVRLLRHPDSKDIWWDRTTISIRSKILFHLF